jgi:hypothetical protein
MCAQIQPPHNLETFLPSNSEMISVLQRQFVLRFWGFGVDSVDAEEHLPMTGSETSSWQDKA